MLYPRDPKPVGMPCAVRSFLNRLNTGAFAVPLTTNPGNYNGNETKTRSPLSNSVPRGSLEVTHNLRETPRAGYRFDRADERVPQRAKCSFWPNASGVTRTTPPGLT